MTPRTLEAIGKTLYGRDWKTPLANAIGRSDKTIGRWHRGENAIPEEAVRDITTLVMTRAQEHAKLAKRLAS